MSEHVSVVNFYKTTFFINQYLRIKVLRIKMALEWRHCYRTLLNLHCECEKEFQDFAQYFIRYY